MLKYFINDEQVEERKFFDELDSAVYNNVCETYDDLLDDCYEMVKIGSFEFYPSQVLYNCDRVAYNCGLSDEHSYQLEERQREFEDEYKETIDGIEFRTEEVEEEE